MQRERFKAALATQRRARVFAKGYANVFRPGDRVRVYDRPGVFVVDAVFDQYVVVWVSGTSRIKYNFKDVDMA
jgi:hypothetical protein